MALVIESATYNTWDATNNRWSQKSFVTQANDIKFSDGTSLQTNLGNIKGITDSLSSTSSTMALSAKAGNDLNNRLRNLPSATLAIGSTSVTISNASITTTGLIDVYTDKFGLSPSNIVITTGQAVVTFPVQTVAIIVKVRCL